MVNYKEQHFTIILGSRTIRKISLHQLIFNTQSVFLCNSKLYRKKWPSGQTTTLNALRFEALLRRRWQPGKHVVGQTCRSAPETGLSSVKHHPLLVSKLGSSSKLEIDPKIYPKFPDVFHRTFLTHEATARSSRSSVSSKSSDTSRAPRDITQANSHFRIWEVQETLSQIIVVLPTGACHHSSCTSDLSSKDTQAERKQLWGSGSSWQQAFWYITQPVSEGADRGYKSLGTGESSQLGFDSQ